LQIHIKGYLLVRRAVNKMQGSPLFKVKNLRNANKQQKFKSNL